MTESIDRALLDILACPLCKSSLFYNVAHSVLICRAERLSFRVENGRPVLLGELATKISVDDVKRLTSGRFSE